MEASSERNPHLATRMVVDTLGHEAPRTLYRAFDEYNAAYFNGALGAPFILITPPGGRSAFGDYAARDLHGLRSTIRIAPWSYKLGEVFALDVLLHEMVHAHQSEIDGDTEPGYRGHGPRFAGKCNEIGARLGLPPVGVKKRGGLPDCAQWPVCVRPPGYHPGWEERQAKRSKAKPEPARRGDDGGDDESTGDGAEVDLDTQRAVKRAYEAGEQAGRTRARLYFARQVRRRVRRLRLAYSETNPRLAALVIAEAETIAHAIESSDHVFYKMDYPKKRTQRAKGGTS